MKKGRVALVISTIHVRSLFKQIFDNVEVTANRREMQRGPPIGT